MADFVLFAAKVNKQKLIIEEVEQLTDIKVEDLAEGVSSIHVRRVGYSLYRMTELPENSPRFVVLSYEYTHQDGRRSFPLILINWVPSGSETGMMTLHASASIPFQEIVSCNFT